MIYINFSAEVNQQTSESLMSFLAQQVNKGEKEFYILLSSPGGDVKSGVTLYNYIRSLPAKFIMHNIGMIDSVANVIFLSGDERYTNPHSSFLFHGVGFNLSQSARFEEKQIKERLRGIKRDQKLIGDIIAERTKIKVKEIEEIFLEAITKTPEEAKKLGFVQEIKRAKVPEGNQVFSFVFHQRPWR